MSEKNIRPVYLTPPPKIVSAAWRIINQHLTHTWPNDQSFDLGNSWELQMHVSDGIWCWATLHYFCFGKETATIDILRIQGTESGLPY